MFHKSIQNVNPNVFTKAGGSYIGNKTMQSLLLTDNTQPVPHFSCILNRGLEYLCS